MAPLRERARFFYTRHFYNRAIRLVPRSKDPYSTHIPVLCVLSVMLRPARIVEYGSGLVSTAAFLNRSAFPSVTSLLSFENYQDWYHKVAQQLGDDNRVDLRLIDGPICSAVRSEDIASAQLVFVDDYDSALPPLPRRSDTIAALSTLKCNAPVVIHDIELRHLERAAKGFEHVFRFDSFNPQTGVAWNGTAIDGKRLAAASEIIKKHRDEISTGDVERWANVFLREEF